MPTLLAKELQSLIFDCDLQNSDGTELKIKSILRRITTSLRTNDLKALIFNDYLNFHNIIKIPRFFARKYDYPWEISVQVVRYLLKSILSKIPQQTLHFLLLKPDQVGNLPSHDIMNLDEKCIKLLFHKVFELAEKKILTHEEMVTLLSCQNMKGITPLCVAIKSITFESIDWYFNLIKEALDKKYIVIDDISTIVKDFLVFAIIQKRKGLLTTCFDNIMVFKDRIDLTQVLNATNSAGFNFLQSAFGKQSKPVIGETINILKRLKEIESE